MFPDFQTFDKAFFPNGLDDLSVPHEIISAIQNNLKSPTEDINRQGSYLSSEFSKNYNKVPDIDYNDEATIDAYTTKYLPRNFHIPKIALRCLSVNPEAVQFSENIKILDLGSGTGAISIGLLHLFNNDILSNYKIDITAVDEVELALARQKIIIDHANLLNDNKWDAFKIDLTNMSDLRRIFNERFWDLIFAGNLFNEIDSNSSKEIISQAVDSLSDNGSLIYCDIQHNRIKELIPILSDFCFSEKHGIYYPCRKGHNCKNNWCWMWNIYGISAQDFQHRGEVILGSDKDLILFIFIINKIGITIYDFFRNNDPNFEYSVGCYCRPTNQAEFCGLKLPLKDEVKNGHIYKIDTKSNEYSRILRI